MFCYVFPYDLNTRLTFIVSFFMIFRLCSFVITYLLEDEQELSLGMLDTSQTYLQFLMLHACSYTICLVFCYTSWHFYAFFGTNLLTRCHSASSLFSIVFCVLEKLYRKYSQNWTKEKPNLLLFNKASRRPKRRRRGATGQPHHRAVRPAPGPRPLVVRLSWSTSDAAPSPIKTPRREKSKDPINFLETHRDPPPSSTRDREGPEALPGTLPKRGIATRGLLHRHACLRRDE
jgi:hypothetical protein